jgi:ethanolamine transporter EutH
VVSENIGQRIGEHRWQSAESFAFELGKSLGFGGAFDDERQDFAIVFGEIIRAVLKITAAFVVVVSQSTDFVSEEFDI